MMEPSARGIAEVGSVICRSEPQMPQFFTLRMMSCAPGTGLGTVSTTSGFDISLKTAARMAIPRFSLDRLGASLCHRRRRRKWVGHERRLRDGTRNDCRTEGQESLGARDRKSVV